ncbi:MAG TPA: DUF362 domain-containing protein [Kiritimatiellia bacterium]|nr:DUF362 domain-containing protein [Kiritimatiellia bacterium]
MTLVVAGITESAYATEPPFHPGEPYPELRLPIPQQTEPNAPFALLRTLFRDAGYDAERFGGPDWNPLGHLIQPGQTVLLKPNFVLHRNGSGDDLFAVVTHPSVLRALIDYVFIALEGRGRIVIADAPQMDCTWRLLAEQLHLDAIQAFYREHAGFDIEVHDLRPFELIDPDQPAYSTNRRTLPGDPAGSVRINLGRESAFHGLPSDRFYGADYNRQETIAHHHGELHEYAISRTVLEADVFISVPKMKTHKKVGVTLNLKGLVGINTNKNCLIHYRVGTPREGGDQLPDQAGVYDSGMIRGQRRLFDVLLARQHPASDFIYKTIRALYRVFIKPFRPISERARTVDAGNWHGNDSAWRMTADLARILYFADRAGKLQPTPQRRMLCVVDGILAGDHEGPLAPSAKPAGCIVLGENPLAVDLATTRLMGFDVERIKTFSLRAADRDFGVRELTQMEVLVRGERVDPATFFSAEWACPIPPFVPHSGWIGHVELGTPDRSD